MDSLLITGNRRSLEGFAPRHFSWRQDGAVGVITLNRPSARTR